MTPRYIRIKLQGPGAHDFAHCTIGANNKIFIPENGAIRTYTHRGIDIARNEIVIDFINHGDGGPAAAWARNAQRGDPLQVAMKIRKTTLAPSVDWYYLIGDATAIPVLSSLLESLPPTAKGHCLIEVSNPENRHPEIQHPGFSVQWLYNPHPEKGSRLSDEVKKVAIPAASSHFAYVACEYRSVKEIRHYFRKELGWKTTDLYAFSYWKAGAAEDQSAEDRRTEKKE